LRVILNTAQAGAAAGAAVPHPVGSTVTVRQSPHGPAYVEIRNLPPSELLILSNHPEASEGGVAG
jgi:hypothetical protein